VPKKDASREEEAALLHGLMSGVEASRGDGADEEEEMEDMEVIYIYIYIYIYI